MKKKILQSIAVLSIILFAGFWGVQKVHAEGWEKVGDAGLGGGLSSGTFSLAISPKTGEPYIAYRDSEWKAAVIKFSNGQWQPVDNESLRNATYCSWTRPSLAINPSTGEPYVAFDDCGGMSIIKHGPNGWEAVGGGIGSTASAPSLSFNPATNEPYLAYAIKDPYTNDLREVRVIKFDETGWQAVGTNASYNSSHIHVGTPALAFNSSTGTPHIAYSTTSNPFFPSLNNPTEPTLTMMRLENDSWQQVGNIDVNSNSLSIWWGPSIAVNPATNEPYVAYSDAGVIKAVKFEDNEWKNIGSVGSIGMVVGNVSLALNPTNDVPYIAYRDSNSEKAAVKKFSGESWQAVGIEGFSDYKILEYLRFVFNPLTSEPYIALYSDPSTNYNKLTVMKYGNSSPPVPQNHHKVAYIPIKFKDGTTRYSISELKQKADLVKEYYSQQSYGIENISSEFILSDNGNWLELNKKLEDYSEGTNWHEKWENIREDAIAVSNINISDYDSAVVIVPECMRSFANEIGGKKIITTEKTTFAVWAHELGHTLFSFEDYYCDGEDHNNGNIGFWGLMGSGTLMSPSSSIMSYNKAEASWLGYKEAKLGENSIKLLTDLNAHDDAVYRFTTPKSNYTASIILEGRFPEDSVQKDTLEPLFGYCSAIPNFDDIFGKYKLQKVKGVEIYTVDKGDNYESGKPNVFARPNIADNDLSKITLTPGESYLDDPAQAKFTLLEKTDGQLAVTIEENVPENKKTISISTVSLEINNTSGNSDEPMLTRYQPDVDLHIESSDGKKIGMKYETGEYEMQVDGANSSLNTPGGGPEWISIPNNVSASYYADATPLKKWAEETGANVTDIKIDFRVTTFDEEGNRQDSEEMTVPINLDNPVTPLAIEANVELNPKTLNLKSNGNWITAFLELPEEYDIRQIIKESVVLNNQVKAEKMEFGDFDSDGIVEAMMKFDRTQVANILAASSTKKVTINGDFMHDGIPLPFVGENSINAESPGNNSKK